MYEVTIERSFAASHGLRHYKGATEPTHEHEWRVWVTVSGKEVDASGCLVDFLDLDAAFQEAVAGWRGRHMNEEPPFETPESSPSAEQVARAVFETIQARMPTHARLTRVEVEEEPGCRAAWVSGA